jgi:hypothetical protein
LIYYPLSWPKHWPKLAKPEIHNMSNNDYTPPKVWTWDSENGGEWAGVNRAIGISMLSFGITFL